MSAGAEPPPPRGSGRKAPSAFRTISEVADDLHIPQHVLRFWETKFPQLKPLKRGGGRRYYRPEDVELLRRISDLLYIQGYTIKGVQRLLREGGAEDEELAAEDMAEPEESEAPRPQLPLPGMPPGAEAERPRGAKPVVRVRAAPPPAAAEGREAALRHALADILAELKAIRAVIGTPEGHE